jgi:hypothetical protein
MIMGLISGFSQSVRIFASDIRVLSIPLNSDDHQPTHSRSIDPGLVGLHAQNFVVSHILPQLHPQSNCSTHLLIFCAFRCIIYFDKFEASRANPDAQ